MIFKTHRREGADAKEYERTSRRMREIVGEISGFISLKGYTTEDGEEIDIVRFTNEKILETWRTQPEHRATQERGRAEFYDHYWVDDAPDLCRIYPMVFVDNAIHFGGGRITVAVIAGRAVGFVLWAPAFEPAWFDPDVERWAELLELHVHPNFHNRGIGTRLVREAVRQARDAGFPAMYLETEEYNGPARRIYEKGGFNEQSRLVRYKITL